MRVTAMFDYTANLITKLKFWNEYRCKLYVRAKYAESITSLHPVLLQIPK